MKAPSPTRSAAVRGLRKSLLEVVTQLDALLIDGNPDTVHDLRTSVRRLQASYSVFPKSVRTKRPLKEYLQKSTALFRATTRVRDLDIAIAAVDGVDESLQPGLARERESAMRLALAAARRLKDSKVPGVSKSDVVEAKLRKRSKNVIRRLEKKIAQELRRTVTQRDADAMHALRKDCKRLRYVLELSLPSDDERLQKLHQVQDELGTVRDLDLVISTLKRHEKLPKVRAVLRETQVKRDALFDKFVSGYRGRSEIVII